MSPPSPGALVIERTDMIDIAQLYREGLMSIDLLPWAPFRTINMTVDNRGACALLRRNHRAMWRDHMWYGVDVRYVELRVWHDGSVTIEKEDGR